ncbi:glycosyltransferase [Nodularia spumigena CS-584]|jgi:1,2-diacylglycerol 3-alpha-glucosyltransferase|uniref:glycosyltransferase n=1 Tax=Nodularia spumigena TaxID=70799 RepID=UPI0000EA9977|nr:glycosyltransferase [Nodularia spumigena]AHJ28644.1 putative hexosyltransferase [Nodularia spumigena CCY9414]EAW44155.1 probable hexosyltransferase [Nodularia spumigena CCY9414]MDB9381744.1 glycosyltransferase [Nodularia spumigena CS-584]
MTCAYKNLKIAILFANYGPYHLARVASAYQAGKSRGWNVFGIELARSGEEYPWQTSVNNIPFKLITVCETSSYEKAPQFLLIQNLLKTLSQIKPDVLAIAGYSEPSMIAAFIWGKLNKKKLILLSESKADDASRKFLKEWLKKQIIHNYHAAVVGGKPHTRYLQNLGMNLSSIAGGYDVVNNLVFHPDTIRVLPSPVNHPYFLTINRFVAKKNIPFILEAYAEYRGKLGNLAWDLVLCGDGELRSQIEAQITQLNLNAHVHLPGFLQENEIMPYFAHAKCFIHASIQEQWGLVVNEAMAAGLPVLVSNRCGCYEDLIIEGVNGFGFNPACLSELVDLMINTTQGKYDLPQISQAALNHINQNFPIEKFGAGLLAAIDYNIRA